MIRMTRRVTFSAAKTDWAPALSGDENRALYGPQAAPEPFGHNYTLDVTVQGEIDPRTGIIVNIKEIDRLVKQSVIRRLDRKFINTGIAEFCGRPVTPEALTLWIAGELVESLPGEVTLAALRLEETPETFAQWEAAPNKSENTSEMENETTPIQDKPTFHESGLMRLTRVYEFAASHRLHSPHLTEEENRELFGKCNYPNGHGHNYILEVTVAGPLDARSGRVMNPAVLDDIVNREVLDRYDHRHFNHDIPEFKDLIPSTEVVTRMIWERLKDVIPAPARLDSILVRETARNIFEYRGEASS